MHGAAQRNATQRNATQRDEYGHPGRCRRCRRCGRVERENGENGMRSQSVRMSVLEFSPRQMVIPQIWT